MYRIKPNGDKAFMVGQKIEIKGGGKPTPPAPKPEPEPKYTEHGKENKSG